MPMSVESVRLAWATQQYPALKQQTKTMHTQAFGDGEPFPRLITTTLKPNLQALCVHTPTHTVHIQYQYRYQFRKGRWMTPATEDTCSLTNRNGKGADDIAQALTTCQATGQASLKVHTNPYLILKSISSLVCSAEFANNKYLYLLF